MATRTAANTKARALTDFILERAMQHQLRTTGLHVGYSPGQAKSTIVLTWPKPLLSTQKHYPVLDISINRRTAKVSCVFVMDDGVTQSKKAALLSGNKLREEIRREIKARNIKAGVAESMVEFLDSLVFDEDVTCATTEGLPTAPTKTAPGRKYPAIGGKLAHVITQVVQFGLDDFQGEQVPESAVFNISYIVSCFLAQHTVEGQHGVPTEDAMEGMKLPDFMPYDDRLKLATQLIADLGGIR